MPEKKETNAKELFELLESISTFVEEKVQMYALGGTALTILGIKPSTLDIDINIDSSKQYNYLCKVFGQIGFKRMGTIRWLTQEGLVFDVFYGSNILGTELLPDCLEQSKFIRSFGLMELYTLSPYDIIISKLARGDERDFNDIRRILEKEKIDLRTLILRYQKTMERSTVGQYKQKLLDLIEIKFGQWKKPLNDQLIQEVRLWLEH
ncbi:MAG TPA: DUF6036 family nucleotidyltransferase [Candidatus Nanoarchaeia archaeon]|nr:DUF6036 family nucleotidyltransferase [Candidatus Nanoarchaeia archaeon]